LVLFKVICYDARSHERKIKQTYSSVRFVSKV